MVFSKVEPNQGIEWGQIKVSKSDLSQLDHSWPKETLQRWHQLPLAQEEFRLIENNVVPYIANRIGSAGAH
jgi:hypothetical protein